MIARAARTATLVMLLAASTAAACSDDPTADQPRQSSTAPGMAAMSTTTTAPPPVLDVADSTPTGDLAYLGPLHRVAVNGIQIGFRRFGSGSPVVLVVGQNSPLGFWGPDLPRQLATHHEVTMFDNRGVGSSTDQPEVPLTIELMADDTAALITALGLVRPTVVGWSTGGEIGLALVARHPDVVGSLVVSGATAGGPTAVASAPAPTDLMASSDIADQAKLFQYLFTPSGAAARERFIAGILRMPSEDVSAAIVRRQAESEERFVASSATYDALVHVRTPTVVINGADDELVPPANARIIADRVPGAQLRVLADASHALMMQYPDWFTSVVDAAAAGQAIPAVP